MINRLITFFICCLFIFSILSGHAAPFTMANEEIHSSYKWEPGMSPYTLSTEDKQYSYVFVFTKQIIESAPKDPDGECKYRIIHERVKLIDDESAKVFSKLYLDAFTPDDYIKVEARILNKQGKVINLNTNSKDFVDENGHKAWVLNIIGLEAGAELEYYYVLKMPFEISGTCWIQRSVPIKKAVFDLYSPKYHQWSSISYNGFTGAKDTVLNVNRLLKVEMNNIPAWDDEYYSYYDANIMRIDYRLTYDFNIDDKEQYTWADAAKIFYKELHVADKQDLKAVKELVRTLDTTSDTKENIRKLEAYIKGNIQMVNNLTIDDESLKTIINSHIGSRNGVLQLYVLALEDMNIPYQMTYTCDRTQKNFDPKFSSWSSLEIELIYFPGLDFYICPLNYSTRMNIIPSVCLDNYALFISKPKINDDDKALAEIKTIKAPFFINNQSIVDAELDFADKIENSRLHLRLDYTGYCAEDIRYYYHSLNNENNRYNVAAEQVYRQIKDTSINNVKVENYNINSPEIYEPLEISADINNTSLIFQKGGQYEIYIGAILGDQAEWTSDKPRKAPIEMLYPHKNHYIFRINVPKGYTIKGMEALKMIKMTGTDLASSSAYFVSDYTYKGGLLEITVNEVYKQGTYPVSTYNAIKEVVNSSYYFSKLVLVMQKENK